MYLHQKISTMYLLCSYCFAELLLLLRWDTGEFRDRYCDMGVFKGGLRCKRWANSVITNAIIEMNYQM